MCLELCDRLSEASALFRVSVVCAGSAIVEHSNSEYTAMPSEVTHSYAKRGSGEIVAAEALYTIDSCSVTIL